ncbi:MAG: sulfatase-like hydrolase/transferase, partial [Bdellovibrionota bacterium]
MSRITGLFLILLSALSMTACRKVVPPSVILIVTERMNSLDLNCAGSVDEDERGGFPVLCREFIRFTHTYTPSLMAVPAMSSLLTGKYPIEHGVRHNGQVLTQTRLVSELALQQGYRTAFFSGGAPVLRKSGLHRGFETFDDSLPTDGSDTYFKPFRKSLEHFKSWVKKEAGSDAYFVVFYAPDLSYTDRVTQDQFGELRNRTFESQLEEFGDGLAELFKFLKDQKRWDSTQIYFTSLNGRDVYSRGEEFLHLNLHSEMTQVPLFIKPAQKKRDEPSVWKVDQNVSLVDVGITIFDEFDANIKSLLSGGLKKLSLAPVLVRPGPLSDGQRVLLTESGWGAQWGFWNVRTALIHDFDLLLWNRQPVLFNMLADRLELTPQVISLDSMPVKFREAITLVQPLPWTIDRATRDFLRLEDALRGGNDDLLYKSVKEAQKNPVLWEKIKKSGIPNYLIYQSFARKDWSELAEISLRFGREDISIYAKVLSGG